MKNKVIDLHSKYNVVENQGIRYSDLLIDLYAPFEDQFNKDYYLEDIIDFAVNAWNLGNLKSIMPPREFKHIWDNGSRSLAENSLLKKLIDKKVKDFKEHTSFIIDYEIKENGGDPRLRVYTQDEETYFTSALQVLENEVKQIENEENYINRQALILKPQKPFFDWLNALYPDDRIYEADESNVYLIGEQVEDLEKWLKKNFDTFFKMELDEWHTRKKDWPKRRTYTMFREWFMVETSSMVFDMEKRPVLKMD